MQNRQNHPGPHATQAAMAAYTPLPERHPHSPHTAPPLPPPPNYAPGGNLAAQAQALRATFEPRTNASPPEDEGIRLGSVQRSETEELRIVWAEFRGYPYLGIRLWQRNEQGAWWPAKGKGIAIRLRELPTLADALSEAMNLAMQPRTAPQERGGESR